MALAFVLFPLLQRKTLTGAYTDHILFVSLQKKQKRKILYKNKSL